MKLYKNMAILFVCGFIIVFIISNFVVPSFVKVVPNSDVDYINNGKYKGDLLISEYNRVVIWNITKRQIDWEYSGDKRGIIFIHDSDILPNGNILISDTVNDRVIEVNITNKKIVWELDFRNMTQFNWSDYADQWGWGKNSKAREYVLNQKPAHGCWTHINEIQFINNSNLPGVYCPIISVSLRNFDMIIEVSYNASKKIVWHAGKPGDHSLMNHQHGTCYLNNSETYLIADSENFRCIQINRSGNIIWQYAYPKGCGIMKWVRDIDPLPNGDYLIDDSNNDILLEINPSTNQIIKTWTLGVNGIPYDADYVPEKGWIIVSSSYTSTVIILDYTSGIILDCIGVPTSLFIVFYCLYAFGIIYSIKLYNGLKPINDKNELNVLKKLKKFENINKIIILGCIIFSIIFFKYVLAAWWFAIIRPIFETIPVTHFGI